MIETLNQIDIDLFLFFNGMHSAFWDALMIKITNQIYWIWLFVLILVGLYFQNRNLSILPLILWVIVPLILAIVLSDHIASSLFKPIFSRLRPCHNPLLQNLINLPGGCGGKYGFFSSHASTSFALVGSIWFSLRKNKRWQIIPVLLWAILFSYSRIYLAKHYPMDIFCGALCGLLVAWVVFKWRDRIYLKKKGKSLL